MATDRRSASVSECPHGSRCSTTPHPRSHSLPPPRCRTQSGRHARRGTLRDAARQSLPVLGRGVGQWLGGPTGGAVGADLAPAAGDLFGLELEGLSEQDGEFEAARAFVRFAWTAACWQPRRRDGTRRRRGRGWRLPRQPAGTPPVCCRWPTRATSRARSAVASLAAAAPRPKGAGSGVAAPSSCSTSTDRGGPATHPNRTEKGRRQ
jgi:hypothetical protein